VITPQPRPPVLGVLGAVASGKSAVTSRLVELGAVALDADREVGGLLGRAEIAARIGDEVDPGAVAEGRVDRRALADAVFSDSAKRAALEAILHPPVVEAARRLADAPPAGARAVVIDAPLLLEAGLDAMCDELWFVDTPRADRVRRAEESRGWNEAELDRREQAQVSVDEKRRRADRVIDNDGTLDALRARVEQAFEALCAG